MNSQNNTYLYLSIISVIIIGTLSWYVFQQRTLNNQLKNQIATINYNLSSQVLPQNPYFHNLVDSTINLPEVTFLKSDVSYKVSEPNHNKYQLLIAFTPNDCPYCFTETDFWEQISVVFEDRIKVLGIVSNCELSECKSFIERENINIPVFYDNSNGVFRKLNIDGSGVPRPIKFFINKKQKILHRSTSTYNDYVKQIRYVKTLQHFISQER